MLRALRAPLHLTWCDPAHVAPTLGAAGPEFVDADQWIVRPFSLATTLRRRTTRSRSRALAGVRARTVRGLANPLVAALARDAPAVELIGLAAGLHAVARRPDGIDAAAAIAAAPARWVGLHDLLQPPARRPGS
jgi:GntR family transcriptional regulator / MocR family aminotransferase